MSAEGSASGRAPREGPIAPTGVDTGPTAQEVRHDGRLGSPRRRTCLQRDTASMPESLEWPLHRPTFGSVSLRAFEARDVDMAEEMSTDSYIPLIGSLPANADYEAALG